MSDIVVILEPAHAKGEYYRVEFIMESIRQSGLSARLYACRGTKDDKGETPAWEIKKSIVLRLLNFLAYLATLRSFAHLGYLLRMWPSLVAESPEAIVFFNYWTGLFLLLWRKATGCRPRLIWDWYDLSTRMRYYGRKMGPAGMIMLQIEERIAPRHFDGLIVPTRSSRAILQRSRPGLRRIAKHQK